MTAARLGRRAWLASAAGCLAVPAFAQVPDWSLRAQQRIAGGPGADFEGRRRLLAEGEQLLAGGDAAAAESAFDRAALMLHAADTEIALVRTYMQQGQYRRALAFCAHAAGVHRDVVAAAALYVWLLHLGGQGSYALQRLDETDRLYPGEPLLAALRQQLAAARPQAQALLPMGSARLAPYTSGAVPPAPARVLATASLLPAGDHAIAPLAALADRSACWVRDGLGRTAEARVADTDAVLGLALLRLAPAFEAVPAAAPPLAEPFGGRPGFVAAQGAKDDAGPEWPLLRAGFLGALAREPGPRALGIDLPGMQQGGVVLDEGGRFVGLAVHGGRGAGWCGLTLLRVRWASQLGVAAVSAPLRAAPDEAYETGLRLALQLIG